MRRLKLIYVRRRGHIVAKKCNIFIVYTGLRRHQFTYKLSQIRWPFGDHYNNAMMIVYSIVYLGTDERKQQSSASLAVVRGIRQWPVNSPLKGPVTRKIFPFDDVTKTFSPLPVPAARCLFYNFRRNQWHFVKNYDISVSVYLNPIMIFSGPFCSPSGSWR